MSVTVCYAKCWGCLYGQHYDPPQPHIWADDEDIDAARMSGRPEPTGQCACWCAREPAAKGGAA